MSSKTTEITAEELRGMGNQEGLILMGCGGDLNEWVNGINDLLTEEGILRNGSRFTDVRSFQHDGVTCLLFPFKNVDLNVGKLAMWRLRSHEAFHGAWLSDFVPNNLGGFRSAPEQTWKKHHARER